MRRWFFSRKSLKFSTITAVLSLLFYCLAFVFPPNATAEDKTLNTVSAIRILPPEVAGLGKTVTIRGVVTALSGWKNSFFLQDGNFGISVDRDFADPTVVQGQLVEVRGVTGAGHFAPVVKATNVFVLGKAPLPAPKRLSFAELLGGSQDSQWISITGLVRSTEIKPLWGQPRLIMTVDVGGGTTIRVRVHDFDPNTIAKFSGAIVTIQGVCGTVFNDRRQFTGVRLFTASTRDIRIEQPALGDPFSLTEQNIGTLLQFRDRTNFNHRVKVRGDVIWSSPSAGLYLTNNGEGLFVQTGSMIAPRVGSSVEVIGYPAVGHYSPRLEDALVRVVGNKREVKPKMQNASEMILNKDGFPSAPFDAMLVTLKGRLVEEVLNGQGELLLMQDGDVFFTARLRRSPLEHVHISEDSILQLTGVCVAGTDVANDAQTFSLFLRDSDDIVVLRNPPWWTAQHATWAFSLMLLAIVVSFVVLAVVKHQQHLRELAVTDPLTGLYNRRGFLLLSQQHWLSMQRQKMSILLFYVDLDKFKEINDTYGHQEGDRALRSVTTLLRSVFRKSDIIGRMGGDEFAVVTIVNSVETRTSLEERLRDALQDLNESTTLPCKLQLSIGVVHCDTNVQVESVEDLLSQADALMYQKKRESQRRPRYIQSAEAVQV